jgi:uncharacterized protein with NRDE domain
MCLILFALDAHPKYSLVLAGNRNEFYERPTKRAHFWQEYPQILAGKDLKAGGTWMGITKSGRFSAVTNYRELPLEPDKEKSRGVLPLDYLANGYKAEQYLDEKSREDKLFAPYNILVGNSNELFYYSNKVDNFSKIESGVHGLSNHLLNTDWPKVQKGKADLATWIESKDAKEEELFEILSNKSLAADHLLPSTGVDKDWEKKLSAMFIESPDYGTRMTTVLLVGRNGEVSYIEREFVNSSKEYDEQVFRWKIES